MTKVIAISNPKGGVGKTTTVINLAASLAIAEKRVLIIDLDPSGGVSDGLDIKQEDIQHGVFEIFSGTATLAESIISMNYLSMDVIPANVYNSEAEIRLNEMAKNRIRLKRLLDQFIASDKNTYDYILFDTPPALNDLTIGVLMAANSVVVPLQCSFYALNAVERLLHMIKRIKRSANPELGILSILLNFYERGTRVSYRSASRAREIFNDYHISIIPKNAAIGFAAFEQRPIALVDVSAPGTQAYFELARKVMSAEKKHLPNYQVENLPTPRSEIFPQ